jgi:Immunity protein 8
MPAMLTSFAKRSTEPSASKHAVGSGDRWGIPLRSLVLRLLQDGEAPGQCAVADEVVELVLHVGPINGPGDELFTVHVRTIDALAKLLLRDGMVIDRHYLFVPGINTERIEAFLNDRMRRLDGDNWRDLAEKIARIGSWEFEDYTAYHEQ